MLWPLFARAPCHWFLDFFLPSSPGVQSAFCFIAPRWAPRPFGGARAKKHHPGCVFFAPAPAKGRGRRSPVGRRHGARAKKMGGGVVFFALAPCRPQRGFSFPCLPPRPEQKKKPGWCNFCSGPAERKRRPTGRNKKKTHKIYVEHPHPTRLSHGSLWGWALQVVSR